MRRPAARWRCEADMHTALTDCASDRPVIDVHDLRNIRSLAKGQNHTEGRRPRCSRFFTAQKWGGLAWGD